MVPKLREQIRSIKNTAGSRSGNNRELGYFIFYMRDTAGLTLETIRSVLIEERILDEDLKEIFDLYDHLMKEQQERSRASSKMMGDVFVNQDFALNLPKT